MDGQSSGYMLMEWICLEFMVIGDTGSIGGAFYYLSSIQRITDYKKHKTILKWKSQKNVMIVNFYTIDCLFFIAIITWSDKKWYLARIQFIFL